jgi:hypothetical protein
MRSVIPVISILKKFKNPRQNLRDEVAIVDVDEEDAESGSSQRLRRVSDYGIEVDFEVLGGEEREASKAALVLETLDDDSWKRRHRIPLEKHLPNSTRP